VAEASWKQKTGQVLKTISGEFAGSEEEGGSKLEWTGTATFERIEVPGADPEVASAFHLTSGQADVTASGNFIGADCTQSGKATIALQSLSLWAVERHGESFSYEIIAPFEPSAMVPVTLSNCHPSELNGQQFEVGIHATAFQSGEAFGRTSQP